MRTLIAAVLLTLASPQPQRDTPPPMPKGTAVVRGLVVAPGSTNPIAGVLVILGGTPASPARPRTVTSDASGKFEFLELPPGLYTISGSPAFYQKQFLASRRAEVLVAEAQIVEGLEIALTRAAVIVGRLVDEFGQPIGGMMMNVAGVNDRPGTTSSSAQSSDELGRFRLFSLTPGTYYVSARPWNSISTNPTAPASEGLLETYYPGTLSRGDATRIEVRAGEEIDAGDLRVLRGRLLRVRGIVVDSQGRPSQANRTSAGLSCKDSGGISHGVDPQGRFDFQPMPPGSCRL